MTPHGESTARQLSLVLHPSQFSLVLTSPRLRARRTCELAGLSAVGDSSAGIEPDLAEWNYGDYEGLSTAEIREVRPGWNVWNYGCPGGESPTDVGARADKLIARLNELGGTVALFSHGQFGRVLAARWIGLQPVDGQHFALAPASVGILGFEDVPPLRRVIRLWNATTNESQR
jgi:probable phosphoglycerate mutase